MRVYFIDATFQSGRTPFFVPDGISLSDFMSLLKTVEQMGPMADEQLLVYRLVDRTGASEALKEDDLVIILDAAELEPESVALGTKDIDPHKDNYRGRQPAPDTARAAMDARLMEAVQRNTEEDREVNRQWEGASHPIDDEPTGHF